MSNFIPLPDLPEPSSAKGVVGWMRSNLFSSFGNTVLTLVAAYIVYITVIPVLDWAIFPPIGSA